MKTKHALIILILGFMMSFIGALFKIMHWPHSNTLLMVATFFQVTGTLILLYKLVTYPKFKDFLNW